MKLLKKWLSIIKNLYKMVINKVRNFYYYCTMKHVEYDVKDVYMLQDMKEGFNRLDIIVRYLAIEEYYGKNNIGFYLYKKMQGNRVFPEYIDESEKKFRELIMSWEKNGYDKSFEISLDSQGSLMDGSHRMSLALYYGVEKVACRIYKKVKRAPYSVEWFIQKGFTNEELEVIVSKEKAIRKMVFDGSCS